MRRIAHLDMDAFFASVELKTYPELKGQAVVVGGSQNHHPIRLDNGEYRYARLGDYVGRGVVTTSTYEARTLGVFSGMGLMKSAKLAPDAILLPANFESYRDYSRRFKLTVATIAPLIEDRGIDEIYIDLTDIDENSEPLAQRIKQAVLDETGLTCSIGISPNKLLSKICSDLQKPDGITIITPDDIPNRIWPLAVKKINGIGPKANEKLSQLDIHTIAQLAQAPLPLLIEHFGQSTGLWMHHAAQGIDDRPVVTSSEPKSLSRESTFNQDLHAKLDRPKLSELFTRLCERVAGDLQRKGYMAKTIGLKLKFYDFETVTRDHTVTVPVDDAVAIRQAAGECLKRVPLEKRIRLLGVRASGLIKAGDIKPTDNPMQSELPFQE